MKIGIHGPIQDFNLSTLKEIVSRFDYIESYVGKCLCQEEIQDSTDMVLAHPHDQQQCFEKLKEVIRSHPQIEFYLINLNGPYQEERQNGIGHCPNLVYLSRPGDISILIEKIHSLK